MNRDLARWLVAFSLAVLGAVAVAFMACGENDTGDIVPGETEEPIAVAPGEGWDVTLYLPDLGGSLTAVPTTVPVDPPGPTGVTRETGLALVQTLLEAEGEGTLPAVEGEVSVVSFDLSPAGVAYVDLGGAPPQVGTRGELLSVYSVVNTVALNVTGVRSVVLLWNGTQRETFAGHIGTTRSLKPRENLVRGES